ncbi:ATP-dependent Clp protease ATP-binding subunit, partial [Candidatus Falkowbacteria bacterium]|nr:ATP-dependent Clp protease ATP-binding subunit [Candidatus Falkowbacteria bacterium]
QNTIIIMTANIGSQHFQPDKKFGFGSAASRDDKNYRALEEKIINETKNYFKIEFLNRVDKIIYFNPLSLADLEKIVKLELEKLNEKLADKNIKLNFTPRLIKFIAEKSDGPTEGARSIQRTIQELLETPLAQKLLADEIMEGDNIRITVKNGIINIKKS